MKKFITFVGLFLMWVNVLNSGTTSKIWVGLPDEGPTVPTVVTNATKFPTLNNIPHLLLDPNELECMAKNIYFEAAVESTAGKMAVAQVTMNRVKSNRYPDTICKVVYEGRHHASGHPKRDQCQFSWYCDGKGDEPRETPAWRDSKHIAKYVLTHPNLIDITDGATHYHADYIENPRWAVSRHRTLQIDTHIFYNKSKGGNFNF
jgi:N-acetylmuramoyl-L-alanine amidase